MNPITKFIKSCSSRARARRAQIFRDNFDVDENTKILDLGSETGSNINNVLRGTQAQKENIYIADIQEELVQKGSLEFGFVPVIINESGGLPFEDNYFDIVYCSSVIEHVTVSKGKVWKLYSGRIFKEESRARQKEFAEELKRLGKQYFVQTPYRYFPIESHSWLPFIAWLPRRLLIIILRFTNLFWIKKTSPDWYLLNKLEMRKLFADANIIEEKAFGLTKSIMAVKSSKKFTALKK